MQRQNLTEIRKLVAATLPVRYEPLLLTFYGHDAREAGEYVIIGDDYGTELHVTADGAVVSIDPEDKLPRRFVNSSITHLARFLQIVCRADRLVDEQEGERWRELADIDPPAFADDNNWWAVVLEQARREGGW